jgi:hypothetical protein
VFIGTGDTQSLFGWDETYGRYVSYARPRRAVRRAKEDISPPKRVVGRSESEDCTLWSPPLDVGVPDADDPPGAELYYMPVHKYHGHYVGFAHVFVPSPDPFGPFWPELTHSRDGIRWRRLNHHGHQRLVHPGPAGSFDSGMIRCARGLFECGDELWLYYGGWHEDHGVSRQHRLMTTPREEQRKAAAIGLATLRLDGFVSLDAGDTEGSLTTAPFVCGAERLVVNARVATGGSIRIGVLAGDGRPLSAFALDSCAHMAGDSTRHTATWSSGGDLSRLRGERIKLRVYLRGAELFSFTA